MKIVKFYGGLGNQLFQYAMLLAIKVYQKEDVYMDTSLYSSYTLHNGLEVNRIFNTTAKEASKEQISKLSLFTCNYKLSRLIHYLLPAGKTVFKEWIFGKYYPEALSKKGDCLYDGYWQHYEYFKNCSEVILKEYTLREPLDQKNQKVFDALNATNISVSVHVRRGDFLKSKLYRGLCGRDYYIDAIIKAKQLVGEDAKFTFFSNDIQWCKDNLSDMIAPDNLCFVDWNKASDSYKDMILQSSCRVNIIANSSFSWWAAYLNQRQNKVVIAPKKWINKKMPNPIQMPEWILL